MKIKCIVLVVFFGVSGGVSAKGFDENYNAYIGDVDSDGYLDVFVKKTPKIVVLHGDIITPIVIPPEVKEFVLRNNGDQTFDVVSDLTSAQITQASQWPESNANITVSDFNLDGRIDILLKNLNSDIFGALEQIIFAPATGEGTPPLVNAAITEDFVRFFQDVSSWMQNPSYFDNSAPLVRTLVDVVSERRSELVWIEGDRDDIGYPFECYFYGYNCIEAGPGNWYYWDVYYVDVPVYRNLPDYSVFNQDALAFTDSLALAQVDGAIEAQSPVAVNIAEILARVLGVEVMEQALTLGDESDFDIDPWVREFGFTSEVYLLEVLTIIARMGMELKIAGAPMTGNTGANPAAIKAYKKKDDPSENVVSTPAMDAEAILVLESIPRNTTKGERGKENIGTILVDDNGVVSSTPYVTRRTNEEGETSVPIQSGSKAIYHDHAIDTYPGPGHLDAGAVYARLVQYVKDKGGNIYKIEYSADWAAANGGNGWRLTTLKGKDLVGQDDWVPGYVAKRYK